MFVALDIGGTSTRIATSTSLQSVILQNRNSWQNTHHFESDYEKLIHEIKVLGGKVKAIGIGIPGDVSKDKKTVYSTSWNQEWENQPIVELLSNKFNCPVFMDNDALVAALGVAYYGEGKDKEFAYVTWGTGIGGASVNKIQDKSEATKLDWYEYFESWEAKCGGRKLESRFSKTADKLSEEEWQKVMEDFYSETLAFSKKVQSELVIFGGGVSSKQKDRILAIGNRPSLPVIRITTLGEDTGLYGGFGLINSRS